MTSAAAQHAYVVNTGSDTVSVIDTTTRAVVDTINAGPTPLAIAVSPNGAFAYVINDAHISVIDTATRAVVGAPIPVGAFPQAISVSPNGAFAYVANRNADTVTVIDTATRAVVGTPISVGTSPRSIAFTPAPAPSPAAVPTMTEWAMILLALMLAGGAMVVIQKRRIAA